MRYSLPKVALALLIFIFLNVGLAQSVSAYEIYSSNDTVKDYGIDDTEWVEFGSGDVAWKTTTMDPQYSGAKLEVQVLNESGGYETVPYVLKVNDFNFERTMADISIAQAKEGAKTVHKILFLDSGTNENGESTGENTTEENTTEENTEDEEYENWSQIDHELKIELTDITEDSQGTPHAKFKYYNRGNPKLEIEVESSTETYSSVSVGETDYLPEKEKDIIIRVKNSGEAWVESVKLDVDLTYFDLSGNTTNLSESDIESDDNHLYGNLGWLAKGEERSINFTVTAPSWEEINSNLETEPCNITAVATGDDILGYEHEGNNTLSCSPPEPAIKVSQQLYAHSVSLEKVSQANQNGSKSNSTKNVTMSSKNNEIWMSSWYIEDSEIHELKDYCVLRQSLHNLEGYPLENLSFVFSPVPDGLLIAEAYKDEEPSDTSEDSLGPSWGKVSIQVPENTDSDTLGDILPESMSGKESYIMNCILVPTRPGTYQLENFSISAECYGHNLSNKSETISLTVHGPQISVNKSIATSGEDMVDVVVTVKNDGDRAASASLSDLVPLEAGLFPDSINIWRKGQLQNSSMPLKEWELEIDNEGDSTFISAAFPLQPGEYYDLKYSLQPENISNMDLSNAEVDFKDRNNYKGTVFSSFFKSGAEVTQVWDYYENSWKVTSKNWDASTGDWAEGWNPITKQWANETDDVSGNDTEMFNKSLFVPAEPPNEKSILDNIKEFITGLLPGGKNDSEPEKLNLSEEPVNASKREPIFIKVKNYFTGLLGGNKDTGEVSDGGQASETSGSEATD